MTVWNSLRMALQALLILAWPALAATPPKDYWLYAASYTSRGGKGIYLFQFHSATGKLEPAGLAAGRLWQANSDAFSGGIPRMFAQIGAEWPSVASMVRGVQNPVYLAVHPNGRYLYSADDAQPPTVSAFRIDGSTGKLTMLSSQPARGKAPCFVTVDRSGRNLLDANVLGPNVVDFPIAPDGSLRSPSCVAWRKGPPEPHPHSVIVSPDNRFALSADMGLDEVLVYRFDAAKGSLTLNNSPPLKLPKGAGARIPVFHPDGRFVYLLSEMGSSITAARWDAATGALAAVDSVSALPKDFHGTSAAAEMQIHPNGRFLYASNRGYDSIAVFAIDRETGKLTPIDYTPSGGRPPRQILLDPTGNYLFVVNVETQNVVEFRVDNQTGRLTRIGEARVPYPSAVQFAPVR